MLKFQSVFGFKLILPNLNKKCLSKAFVYSIECGKLQLKSSKSNWSSREEAEAKKKNGEEEQEVSPLTTTTTTATNLVWKQQSHK